MICRLEYAIIHQAENGHFDIECVAQYAQNTRERLPKNLQKNLTLDVRNRLHLATKAEKEAKVLIRINPVKQGC